MALLQISEPETQTITGNEQKTIAVGIDLGTTNSLVALIENNQPQVLCDETLSKLVPSVVNYNTQSVLVGNAALKQLATDPQNTIVSIKRFIGRKVTDLLVNKYPYAFSDNQQIIEIITALGTKNPITISADILLYLKNIVENHYYPPTLKQLNAVITVPAYFNETQRQATKQAAAIANINVLRLLNEPTAAAIAYGLDKNNNGIFMVYDLGGGTFDVSVLRMGNGVFEVLAVGGDTNLGGDDFDQIICEHIAQELCYTEYNQIIHTKILIIAKQLKHQLTTNKIATMSIDINNQQHNISITQEWFINNTNHLIIKTIKLAQQTLRDARILAGQLAEIILVGGATRMVNVKHQLTNAFSCTILDTINPDEVVAIGAAISADILVGNQKSDWLLLDVTPLSLGIETVGGAVEKMIMRNTTIPAIKTQDFTTYIDNQTALSLHVLQGEGELVTQCRSLAKFSLTKLTPMKAGTNRIRVTFQIDADGLLLVSATELSTNKSAHIEVNPSFGLNQQQIEEMISNQ
jgi:molecular chaperone HscA